MINAWGSSSGLPLKPREIVFARLMVCCNSASITGCAIGFGGVCGVGGLWGVGTLGVGGFGNSGSFRSGVDSESGSGVGCRVCCLVIPWDGVLWTGVCVNLGIGCAVGSVALDNGFSGCQSICSGSDSSSSDSCFLVSCFMDSSYSV